MLQVTYPEYWFSFIPLIVDAMRVIPIDLKPNVKKLGFYENKAAKMMKIGSVKICKSFVNFKTFKT